MTKEALYWLTQLDPGVGLVLGSVASISLGGLVFFVGCMSRAIFKSPFHARDN